MKKRLFCFLLDGFGCGETEDSFQYNDSGANTSQHILEKNPFLKDTFLYQIGFFHCKEKGSFCFPQNPNKDTFSCTMEMFGTLLSRFRTFPEGFPPSVINCLEHTCQTRFLGNIAASGTLILQQLGEQSLQTRSPILYTSADSVMQIAAHIQSYPLSQLYYLCEIARRIFCAPLPLGRVIARPFTGSQNSSFQRTPERKDFGYPVPANQLLLRLTENNVLIYGNRIFREIFQNNQIHPILGQCNDSLYQFFMDKIQQPLLENELYLINLEDFDMIYGHRRDTEGFAKELSTFSQILKRGVSRIKPNESILLFADHGNDPTFLNHTDHTREYTPFLQIFSDRYSFLTEPKPLSHIGTTILQYFQSVL